MLHRRTARVLRALALAGALGVAAGCGGPAAVPASPTLPVTSALTTMTAPTATASPTPSNTPTPTVTGTTPKPVTTTPKAVAKPAPVRTSSAPKTSTKPKTTSPPKPAANTCKVPSGVTAPQVVLVDSSGSAATVRACAKSGSTYVLQHGPYSGHVGRNGVSWNKREGDGTTPGGTYALTWGFGNNANPGLKVGNWKVVDSLDVWVDDAASALYNTPQREPANGRWSSAEHMNTAPAYNYSQVVNYNPTNVPGKGSGIFFHVDQGRGTAGCVSLPTSALLTILRWEKPGVVMSIR